ncbi:peptidase M50, partial [Pseudomonas sp. CrR25]|nr:peptidase M50 [Pseudomonas sp. CrR25]
SVRLVEISATGTPYLDIEALASDHSGPIAVRRDQQRRAQPLQAQYAVHLALADPLAMPSQPVRGVVLLRGEPESMLGAAWRRLVALFVRESGF